MGAVRVLLLMVRIAWFAPGLGYANGELIRQLQSDHQIDRYADRAVPASDSAARHARTNICDNAPAGQAASAHDFVWRHRRDAYDLTVFEIADLDLYSFVWPYLVRYPGLVILHDGHLHESRKRALRQQSRLSDYQAEFAFSHPDAPAQFPRAVERVASKNARELWPMRRVVVESSRCIVSSNRWLAQELVAEATHSRILTIEPGVQSVVSDIDTRSRLRRERRIPPSAVIFACLESLTVGHRLLWVLSALRQLEATATTWHLLLPVRLKDRRAVHNVIQSTGLSQWVSYVDPDDQRTCADVRATADVCVCLQWPARADGHWRWLECLAAGKPSIIFDLADRVTIPTLDPRDGLTRQVAPVSDESGIDPQEPVAVALDVMDEYHSLRLAVQRLAVDGPLRQRLGDAAHRIWRSRFGLDRMATEIGVAIQDAADVPLRNLRRDHLPAHLLADGYSLLDALTRESGLPANPLRTQNRRVVSTRVARPHTPAVPSADLEDHTQR